VQADLTRKVLKPFQQGSEEEEAAIVLYLDDNEGKQTHDEAQTTAAQFFKLDLPWRGHFNSERRGLRFCKGFRLH
jgi:hypothetical protein